MNLAAPSAPIRVAALYRIATIADCAVVRDRLDALCRPDVRGTVLVAHEGLNGTIAGPEASIDRVLTGIRALPGFADLDVKFADADAMPFHRLKVRIKPEIVTMGQPDLDPAANAGTYVAPADWNALTREHLLVPMISFTERANSSPGSTKDTKSRFDYQRPSNPSH